MKNASRFFAILLALIFSLSAFLACDSGAPDAETTGTTTTAPGSDTAPGDTEPPADEGPVISEAAQGITIATEEMVAQWEALVESRRQEILNTPNMDVSGFKKVYYISPNGDDSNDGLSPETAWKTIDKLNSKYIGKDCCVCFERGGIYRGKITAAFGVTYTAYGEGPKPEIWGSPMNGAEVGTWEEVAPNIWRYSEKLSHDVGVLVMNGGEAWGYKITLDYGQNPPTEFRDDGTVGPVWEGYTSLNENYEFWHDLNGMTAVNQENPGYVYLYCDKGNPADVWDDIEFNTYGNIIQVNKDNVTVDNLTVKYGGGAGIGGGSFNMKNFTVTNCEIGWIGGSIQTYTPAGNRLLTVRFGNGVEIYGGCTNYVIDNCWIYEIFDSAVTFQYGNETPESSVTMENVHFTNNVMEKYGTGFEYFVAGSDELYPEGVNRYMKDVYFTGNIMLDSGYGFSTTVRPGGNESHISGFLHWNKREGEFIIENNLFLRSKFSMINIGAAHYEELPEMRNNVFVQTDYHQWGRYEENVPGQYIRKTYTYEVISDQKYEGNQFYVLPKAN